MDDKIEERKKRLSKRAVALHHSEKQKAPMVVAKGAGVVAEKILEVAESKEVVVYKDAKLVEELTRMDLGDHIPPELYEVVAQVLVFINELDSNAGQSLESKLGLDRLKPIGSKYVK